MKVSKHGFAIASDCPSPTFQKLLEQESEHKIGLTRRSACQLRQVALRRTPATEIDGQHGSVCELCARNVRNCSRLATTVTYVMFAECLISLGVVVCGVLRSRSQLGS